MPLDNTQSANRGAWDPTLGISGSTGDRVKRMSSDFKLAGSPSGTVPDDLLIPDQLKSDQSKTIVEPQKAFHTPKVSFADAGELTWNALQPQRRIIVSPLDLSFYPLQEWEGYVVDVQGDTFTARLVDKTANKKTEGEVGEFAISDLTEDDRELLKPGAVFRWTIGYLRTKGGTKRRVSDVVFRRLPQWTKGDLKAAKDRAAKLAAGIRWE